MDTSPQAIWLEEIASTKAGRYVSPIPTITLDAMPSAVIARRSRRTAHSGLAGGRQGRSPYGGTVESTSHK